MHRDARHVVPPPLDLSRVHADADVDAELAQGVADRDRTLHGPGRAVEDREHPVARPLDQAPAEAGQLAVDRPVVLLEAGRPGPVAERGGLLGRADDVGEEDRGQEAVAGGHLPGARQELLYLPGDVRSAGPGDVVGRVELHVARTVDVLGEVAPVAGPAEPVVTGMEHERRHAQAAEDGPHVRRRRPPHRPRRRRARPPVTGAAPPRGEAGVGDHARGHQGKVVAAGRTRFDDTCPEPLQHVSGYPVGIVVAPGEAGVAVHHDERLHPLRMRGSQQEGSQSAEVDPEDRGLLDPEVVEDGQRVTGPLLDRRGIGRPQRVRQADAPQVEPDEPGEGRQPVHVGLPAWLLGGGVHREVRAVGQLDEREGTGPLDLVRDVEAVARRGVADLRDVGHQPKANEVVRPTRPRDWN